MNIQHVKKLFIIQLFIFVASACADNNGENNQAKTAGNSSYFQVTGVSENDTLSLRLYASNKAGRVLSIPYDANGLLKLQTSKNWIKVSYSGKVGWVYRKYLRKAVAPSAKSIFSSEMSCLGTEPHWVLQTKGNQVSFGKYDKLENYVLDSPIRQSLNDTSIWSLTAVNSQLVEKSLSVLIKRDKQCSDGMSDNSYLYTIIIRYNNIGLMSGCCR